VQAQLQIFLEVPTNYQRINGTMPRGMYIAADRNQKTGFQRQDSFPCLPTSWICSLEKELPYLPVTNLSQEVATKDTFLFHQSSKLPGATIGTNQVLLGSHVQDSIRRTQALQELDTVRQQTQSQHLRGYRETPLLTMLHISV
jgi:hypothetical protein